MKTAPDICLADALAVLNNSDLDKWFRVVSKVTDPPARLVCEKFVGVPVSLSPAIVEAISPGRVVRQETRKPSPQRAKPVRAKRGGWNHF